MGCHDLSFLNVEFQASFFTLLLHFHQELFSSSSLSAIKVVSSVYLKLLIFLLAILATVHEVMATTCSPRLQSMGSHRGRRRVQPAEGTVPELAPFCSTLLTSLGLFTHQRCWGSHGGSRPTVPIPELCGDQVIRNSRGFVNHNMWTRLLKRRCLQTGWLVLHSGRFSPLSPP